MFGSLAQFFSLLKRFACVRRILEDSNTVRKAVSVLSLHVTSEQRARFLLHPKMVRCIDKA